VPFIEEAMQAGYQGDQALNSLWPNGDMRSAPLASTYFNMRKTTIYGGSNEVQRNIVAQVVLG
jgi:alkylation response protein AidB-like acyl-CoA dehydrogenase